MAHAYHNALCNIEARFWGDAMEYRSHAADHMDRCTANTHGSRCLDAEGSAHPAMTSAMACTSPVKRQAGSRVIWFRET